MMLKFRGARIHALYSRHNTSFTTLDLETSSARNSVKSNKASTLQMKKLRDVKLHVVILAQLVLQSAKRVYIHVQRNPCITMINRSAPMIVQVRKKNSSRTQRVALA